MRPARQGWVRADLVRPAAILPDIRVDEPVGVRGVHADATVPSERPDLSFDEARIERGLLAGRDEAEIAGVA